VLIECSEILKNNKAFIECIDDCFINQYSVGKSEDYKQLEKAKKALLIDNFHKIVNPNYKDALIKEFKKYSDVVVIGVDEFFDLKDLLGSSKQSNIFPFKHLILSELGAETTGKLIRTWVNLNQRPDEDETTIVYRIKMLEHSVDSVTRTNRVFPPNPFVVLSLIQIFESNSPIGTISGSYGYLYEFIITGSFANTSKEIEDVDIKYNFLGYIANYMFENKVKEISKEAFIDLANRFGKYAEVTIWPESIIQAVLDSRIMKVKESSFGFAHSYVYHYFVAKYLSTIINDPDEKSEFETKISLILNDLESNENTNIVIFLSYLTPGDMSLITKITTKAKELFSGHRLFNLPSDGAYFDGLPYKEPIVTVGIDPETEHGTHLTPSVTQ
jgi:hypothetical protein